MILKFKLKIMQNSDEHKLMNPKQKKIKNKNDFEL